MKENIKKDYLKYLFHRTQKSLNRYQISNPDSELIKNIFDRLSVSENLPLELYILFNIKEFKKLSKYFIFIIKKIEDNLITFDNLKQNLQNDSEFIENEILAYLSNPVRKDTEYLNVQEEKNESGKEELYNEYRTNNQKAREQIAEEEMKPPGISPGEEESDSEISKFKESYLELIQSEEGDGDIVYELPVSRGDETEKPAESAFDLPGPELIETETVDSSEESNAIAGEGYAAAEDQKIQQDEKANTESEEEVNIEKENSIFSKEENRDTGTGDSEEEKLSEDEKIQLSEEIQEELNLFKDNEGSMREEDDEDEEEVIIEETFSEPANELFLEFENEIKDKNDFLTGEFEKMISIVASKDSNDEERSRIISNILETSNYLESISRNMSLEIISNVYQTITLSFEKISESKYDISESTLNLFKKGLSLVLSLIKGDDYYGYKDILKSIENIRYVLLEEKQKRETYLKRLQEKLDFEKQIDKKYPDEIQKEKILMLKQIIKETESNFKSLETISGEYQIYEALRSLSGNLNNFKNIVKLSKELQMKKLVQLAEAGYIFVKFLQNYRINPVTIETNEIFGYIIYNLKSLVVEKTPDDIDLFISYLNDPVKIFSKAGKKK